jgi:hypothetical protein
LVALCILAVLAQGTAILAIAVLRGTPTAYAFQSPDAGEYVALARGLAWQGRYIQLDLVGEPLTGHDTWRTPGYPLFLAAVIKLTNDRPLTLLIAQQLLAAASVPLLWLTLRPLARPHWALLAAVAWCFDPFRLYYSLWLMAETLFTLGLILACWLWLRMTSPPQSVRAILTTNKRLSDSNESGLPRNASDVPLNESSVPVNESGLPSNEIPDHRPARLSRHVALALGLGLLTGTLVLIRPIGLPLPILAAAGLLMTRRRPAGGGSEPVSLPRHPRGDLKSDSLPRYSGGDAEYFSLPRYSGGGPGWGLERHRLSLRIVLALTCLTGSALTIAPWLLRNQSLTGHLALTHQTGASFAYHKVADVILRSQGRADERFSPDALEEIRDELDRRLREKWEQQFGLLTPAQRDSLTWRKLNYGHPVAVDPFVASSLLWSVGLEALADRKLALVQTFTIQGVNMLIFPLGLVLDPPAGTGSTPMSTLLAGRGPLVSTLAPAIIGLAYAALALAVLLRLVTAARRRRLPAASFAFWPAIAMLVLSLPFEDPRFRLPLIPLFWILAVWHRPPASESVPPASRR